MKLGAEIRLKAGKERSLRRRHPWVYDTAVASVKGRPQCGDTVAVLSHDGQWLAWAAYAPDSSLRARCWSFCQGDTIDADWFAAKLRAAVARRRILEADTNALRLVFGEADGLPGFVADRYADQLVVQLQSAGAWAQRDVLIEALSAATDCPHVFERSDSAARAREGLAPASGLIAGTEPALRIEVHEQGIRYFVDVYQGHKTGFYIDQRDNRHRLAQLVAQWSAAHGEAPRVLNCFCYTGGFSLAAARGLGGRGAREVVSIDASAPALALAQENWRLNGLASCPAQWLQADVFDALRSLHTQGERFDLIVLDPPKFAANHRNVERAARAYKDINLSALRLLAPGGMLLTFSCSGAISVELFQKIVAGAVIDARVDMHLMSRLSAGIDHPLAMTHPEGEYLKGLWLART